MKAPPDFRQAAPVFAAFAAASYTNPFVVVAPAAAPPAVLAAPAAVLAAPSAAVVASAAAATAAAGPNKEEAPLVGDYKYLYRANTTTTVTLFSPSHINNNIKKVASVTS